LWNWGGGERWKTQMNSSGMGQGRMTRKMLRG